MRYLALATDYDGTLAQDGIVPDEVVAALERLRASGRRALLVTGRELPDLQRIFPHLELFDWVVAENGALLYNPALKEGRLIAPPVEEKLVARLREMGVQPLAVGQGIIATWHPNEHQILEATRELGLEVQVIFNKGAVMVLPAGVNKASGLAAALAEMKLSPHNVIGVGDAENDQAFLSACECAVAVANAIDAIKERACFVTERDHGAGVVELIGRLLATDLEENDDRIPSGRVLLGRHASGAEEYIVPLRKNILVAGASGAGKSTAASALLEQLAGQGYQFCIVDPEGDYEGFESSVSQGNQDHPPQLENVMDLLVDPRQNISLNLLGIPMADRPAFFASLLTRLQEMKQATGRPHWLLVDEAHHLLPAGMVAEGVMPKDMGGVAFVTVEPQSVSRSVTALVDVFIGLGRAAAQAMRALCERLAIACPPLPETRPEPGMALVWRRSEGQPPVYLELPQSQSARRRHRRKYAAGDVREKAFYFRGPDDKLNLRAQNLAVFLQLAEGVDDETWMFHLRQHDYSRWFREAIKDEGLAELAENVESREEVSPEESRRLIREHIEKEYVIETALG